MDAEQLTRHAPQGSKQNRGFDPTSRLNLRRWLRGLLDILLMAGVNVAIQYFIKAVHFNKPVGMAMYDNSWHWAWEHHLWQLGLSLVLIGLFSRGAWRAWGFTLTNWRSSLSLLWKFCLVYACIEVPMLVYSNIHGVPQRLDATNVIAWLSFAWLMSGVSEETLFRGLMHSYLKRSWPGVWHWGRVEMPVAGVLTAVIFTLAHISLTLWPFRIIYFSIPQLATAFILGLYYSAVYHRTGSLLGPMLSHNFADGIIFSTMYLMRR